MDKTLFKSLVPMLILIGIGLSISYFFNLSNNNYQKNLKAYFQGEKIINDFKHGKYQDILVAYPLVTIYHNQLFSEKPPSKEMQQMANESRCDFIFLLFKALNANDAQKKQILEFLKTENIQVENIYRNKFGQVQARTEQNLSECSGWYPNK